MDFTITNSNHWAAPGNFINRKTQNDLTFTADYEQTAFFIEMGKPLSKKYAVSLEVPYVARHEGAMTDKLINSFHKFFDFDNFGRPSHPYGQKIFETSTNGTRRGPLEAPSGAGNLKLKLKYWPIQWKNKTGVGASASVKAPIDDAEKGMTSGGFDYHGAIHLGYPIGQRSAVFSTLAFSYLNDNWMFSDWPRNKFLWMFDVMFDLALNQKWSVVLDFMFQSPLMKKDDLGFVYTGSTIEEQVYEKVASGYFSLVEIRGQQMIGVKRTFGKNHFWSAYFIEDWGFGDKDNNNDMVYHNGQPDFGIGFKINWAL